MNCDRTRELLVDFLYGELPAELAVEVQKEIDQCPRCAAEYRELHQIREMMGAVPSLEVPAQVHQNILREARLQMAQEGARTEREPAAWLRLVRSPVFAAAFAICLVLVATTVLLRQSARQVETTPPSMAAQEAAPSPTSASAEAQAGEPAVTPVPAAGQGRWAEERMEREPSTDLPQVALLPPGQTGTPSFRDTTRPVEAASAPGPERAVVARRTAPQAEEVPGWRGRGAAAEPTTPSVAPPSEPPEEGEAIALLQPMTRESEMAGGEAVQPPTARIGLLEEPPAEISAPEGQPTDRQTVVARLDESLRQVPDQRESRRAQRGQSERTEGREDIHARMETESDTSRARDRSRNLAVDEADHGGIEGRPQEYPVGRRAGRTETRETPAASAPEEPALVVQASPPPVTVDLDGDQVAGLAEIRGEDVLLASDLVPEQAIDEGMAVAGQQESTWMERDAEDQAFAGLGDEEPEAASDVDGVERTTAAAVEMEQAEAAQAEVEEIVVAMAEPTVPAVGTAGVTTTMAAETETGEGFVTLDELFNEGVEAFHHGDYPRTIQQLGTYLGNAPPTTPYLQVANFYQGQAQMAVGNYQDANLHFQMVVQGPSEFAHYQEAIYLLARSYEMLGDMEQAEANYIRLESTENPYQEEADQGLMRVRRASRAWDSNDEFEGGEVYPTEASPASME